ncbi:MFS transporter [Aneurinibacillus tyrosinisolvens]|uniref:MFS transporter n=1 Tax=Aneurinibacillus tyrosinisolvens TaxID=1443435 RepID=UPI00069A204F|nr:MFS transporter [Aneurinibacillus tyrosinisolvens]
MEQTAKLDSQSKLLLLMNTLYLSSIGLSNTLVNVYLWKVRSDYATIGRFNLFIFMASPFTFWLAGHMVKKVDRVFSIRLGVFIMAAFYLLVLFLGESSVRYTSYLGLLLGMGTGFYWLGYYVLYFEITSPFNRDTFNGMNGFLLSLASGVAPFVAGWLVTRQANGYRMIFTLSLCIFLLAVLVSFFIRSRKADGQFTMTKVWKDTVARSRWHYVMFACFFWGIREGVVVFLISLLVYITSSSEFTLGVYAFFTSAISLLSYYMVGKWIQPSKRGAYILLGGVMLCIVVLPLFGGLSFTTLLLLGIGSALFYPFFTVPVMSSTFDVIGENMDKARQRVEYIVIREFAFSLGRLIGASLFLVCISFSQTSLAFAYLLIAVNAMLLFCWFFMRKVLPANV